MHLTTAIVLLIGSLAAAAPSIQHAQISVEVIHTDAQNHADVVHSSVGTGTNNDGFGLKYLPFNFTLSARYANGGPTSLPFGFENLDVGSDGFVRGELGFPTVFAFREGKLINGNRALGGHVHRIFPGWTSLWSLERAVHRPWFELIAIPQPSTLKPRYYLEFERSGKSTLVSSTLIRFIHFNFRRC